MSDNTLIDLGELYPSGFVENFDDAFKGDKYPLKMVYNEELKCAVLNEQPPMEMMWGEYYYKSGINRKMVDDLKDVVEKTGCLVDLSKGDIWLDIASNDGTLLRHVKNKYPFLKTMGIDPVEGEIGQEAIKNMDWFVQSYFSKSAYPYPHQKAKVITCCAMFYDLPDPISFLVDVKECMDDNGVFVMQYTYTGSMLLLNDFTNICHEHYAYHFYTNVKYLLNSSGLIPFNVELNDVNGGSIRIYCKKPFALFVKKFTPIQSYLYNSNMEMIELLESKHYNGLSIWSDFKIMVEYNKMKTVEFIRELTKEGKSVWGYGASTKGNTMLQYFGLDFDDIEAIAEANEQKWGLYTKGSGIKIVSEDLWRRENPEYTLVLPWQFIGYFTQKEKEYLDNGGKFIVCFPNLYLITKDGQKYI